MKEQTHYLIIGFIIGIILASQCNRKVDCTDGEVIKSDTIVRIKYQNLTVIKPQIATTLPTARITPVFNKLEYCQKSFDTLFISYNDTNYYEIDTNGLNAKIWVSENRLFKSNFTWEIKETEINNTVIKKRFQILYGGGLSYPFGAFASAGFKTKSDLSIFYQYHTNNSHSVGVIYPLKFK